MPIFYGSFGCGQTFADKSVQVEAEDIEIARAAVYHTFGPKFCSMYKEEWEESEWFQPPVMKLVATIPYPHAEYPEVRCVEFYPENLPKGERGVRVLYSDRERDAEREDRDDI
jgi:hypothetical protein